MELAEHLGISPLHAYNLIKRGEIRAYKVGAIYRIAISDVEEYLRKNQEVVK